MSQLHPHWQETEDDERPVPVRAAPKTESMQGVPRAQRGPGALAGIAVFLVIGFVFAQGLENLLGQTSGPETIVSISENGVSPSVVSVRPGETITWENSDTIPHVLSSNTIPTGDGKPFETSAIFPQGSYSYVVPMTAQAGTHDYISQTAQSVGGQVLIIAAGTSTTTGTTGPATTTPPRDTSAQMPANSNVIGAVNEVETFPAGVIPVNPHTIGSPGAVLPPRQQPVVDGKTVSVTQHTPVSQPTTGNGTAIVIVTSLGLLYAVTRKSFARV